MAQVVEPAKAHRVSAGTVASGAALWVLLMGTVLGSTWLIQHYFGEDVLRVRTKFDHRLEAADVLVQEGTQEASAQALRTLRVLLAEQPGSVDAVLLLEQALLNCPVGTNTETAISSYLVELQGEFEKKAAASSDDAASRFVLSRLYRRSGRADRRGDADRMLDEARALLEKKLASSPKDADAAFLMARVLLSKPNADSDAHRRAIELVRIADRTEAELRLRLASRVPVEVQLQRAAETLELGLVEQADRHIQIALADDRENGRAKYLKALVMIVRRPPGDRAQQADLTILASLEDAVKSDKAPPIAHAYLGSIKAMLAALEPEPADRDKAMTAARDSYRRSAQDGADPVVESASLIPRGLLGAARLLLAGEILLGEPKGKSSITARVLRAELLLNDARDQSESLRAAELLREAVELAPDPKDVPARAVGLLSSLEPELQVAQTRFKAATARGFDPVSEAETYGKSKLYGTARTMLDGLTRDAKGLALTGDPKGDSEVWYQLGRACALGLGPTDPLAVENYEKAVKAGGAAKTPGAGKSAFSLARILAADPHRAEEVPKYLDLAEACGITKMDITSLDQLRSRLGAGRMAPGRLQGGISPH